MDIQIYTDLEDPKYVFIDFSSLIHAYTYAIKEENQLMARYLLSLFHEGSENVRISKTSPIYTFLKTSPYIKENEITWKTIKEAYIIARLQNNNSVLRILGKVLGHWEQYVLEKNECGGLLKEVAELPKPVYQFVLKYHDVSLYENKKREQTKPIEDNNTKTIINRSVVEIGYDHNEKTYKKAA